VGGIHVPVPAATHAASDDLYQATGTVLVDILELRP